MSSTTPVGRSLARTLRKVEAPRPLKGSSSNEPKTKSPLASSTYSYSVDSAEKLVALMDLVVNSISQMNNLSFPNAETASSLTVNIINLCKYLKIFGPQLENSAYLGQLDRAFVVFREYMVRPDVECEVRARLLEIIELRLHNWVPQKSLSPFGNYLNLVSPYQDWNHLLEKDDTGIISRYYSSETTTHLGTDEVLARSVPPTAKERLIQITGSSEEKISCASRLIENTIRNNSSPMSGSDSSFSGEDINGKIDLDTEFPNDEISDILDNKLRIKSNNSSQPYQYKHKVIVRNCCLTITGDDYNYVTVAKAVLDDYFSKLRASELPNEDSYSDEVFVEDLETDDLLDNNFVSFAPPPVPERSSSITDSNDNNLFISTPPMCSDNISPIRNENSLLSNVDFTLKSEKNSPVTRGPLIKPAATRTNFQTLIETIKRDIKHNVDNGKQKYTKEFLLLRAKSPSSRKKPENWEIISKRFPQIIGSDW